MLTWLSAASAFSVTHRRVKTLMLVRTGLKKKKPQAWCVPFILLKRVSQVSFSGYSVFSALLILMSVVVMEARSVWTPLALTINRLATTRLGAVLFLVFMKTLLAIVQCMLGDVEDTAPFILVV